MNLRIGSWSLVLSLFLSALGSAHAAEAPALALATQLSDASHLPRVDLGRDSGRVLTVDLTAREGDIWNRMRNGFGMTDLHGPLVEERQRWYLSHPQSLKIMLERGRKYLYHIVVELEKRGMPSELALLPLVESAYNPMAISSAKAAGLWQFIPSTGKDFNLQQNWWVDERRDIVASTNAALQYLQAIYEMHGDWHLALASYNWGENAVARAVNNNRAAGKPTDYSSINMPLETRHYVPKLQALKNIIADPRHFGLDLPNIPDQPYFVTVEKPKGIDVALAAKLAEMPTSEFLSLNPGYNRPVIPGSQDNPLVLPVENARKFKENLAQHDAPLVSWKTYAVPRSERLEDVARRLRLAVDTLRTANGLPASARLAAGYVLLIPTAAVEQVEDVIRKALPGKEAKPQTRSVARRPVQRHGAPVKSAQRRH